jgi:hypothetical protein
MTAVCILSGLLLILLVLAEAFEALVQSRRVTRPYRLTRLYYRSVWWTWTRLAALLPAGRRRESFLSVFGPLSLLTLFALWAAGLVLGFGLVQYALAPESHRFVDMVYFSGATFTTLGYGDIAPVGSAARLLAVVESATGFGFFAVVIAYLPVLYQAFSRRETLISLLDARAGSPPAAGRLLERLPPGRGDGAVLERFLEEAETWAADVLESHLSFPVLGFYRSQHDNQSWVAALTCALDTAALLLTVVEGVDRRQARLTFAMARHAVVDLSLVLRRPPQAPPADRLPEARLQELCEALRKAGAAVRDDEEARAKLRELRGLYEPFAVAVGAYFRLSLPDVWPEGDRPDNWQTSAWMRRAGPLTALGVDPRDEHFA